ncbi:MAG: hypothetical protein DDT34_02112 [Firmicutes bacterium]|nr:hypothetical protein [Bacillota bacterium]
MTRNEQFRYIEAFASVMGINEDRVTEYVHRKGIASLVENATQLLTTPKQREKHQALLDLYRMSVRLENKNPVITSPEQAAAFFHSVLPGIHDKESVVVAFLNFKNRLIDYEIVSVGTIDSTLLHPRDVFRGAIVSKASGVLVCHNHPSGDISPSSADKNTHNILREAGKLLNIQVLDHIIISGLDRTRFYSMTQEAVTHSPLRSVDR